MLWFFSSQRHFFLVTTPNAMLIIPAFKCFCRASSTPITLVAHQTISTNSIALKLSTTIRFGPLWTEKCSAGIYFISIFAKRGIFFTYSQLWVEKTVTLYKWGGICTSTQIQKCKNQKGHQHHRIDVAFRSRGKYWSLRAFKTLPFIPQRVG